MPGAHPMALPVSPRRDTARADMLLDAAGWRDAVSRVGLTIQQTLGMPVTTWGDGAMQTAKPIGEVMA